RGYEQCTRFSCYAPTSYRTVPRFTARSSRHGGTTAPGTKQSPCMGTDLLWRNTLSLPRVVRTLLYCGISWRTSLIYLLSQPLFLSALSLDLFWCGKYPFSLGQQEHCPFTTRLRVLKLDQIRSKLPLGGLRSAEPGFTDMRN